MANSSKTTKTKPAQPKAQPAPEPTPQKQEEDEEYEEAEMPVLTNKYKDRIAALETKMSAEEGADALYTAVVDVVECYSGNGSIAFWDAFERLALEFILDHEMLNGHDTDAALNDLEAYEILVSQYGAFLMALTTAKSMAEFEKVQQDMFKPLSKAKLLGRLYQMLRFTVEASEGSAADADGDSDLIAMYKDIKAAREKELKPGHFAIRVRATLDALDTLAAHKAQKLLAVQ